MTMHALLCHLSVDCEAVKEMDGCVEQCYASSPFANRDDLMLFAAA